jgi:hypothetical protein
VAFFRRNTQSSRVPAPHMPPREQRRLIREADRQNYTSHGYRALTSYAFAKDIIPGKLVGLIHDQLTEGGGSPERSAVWVGVHDVDLGRGVAAVMGEKYSSAGATFGESLPQDGDESVEGRSLSTVLLFPQMVKKRSGTGYGGWWRWPNNMRTGSRPWNRCDSQWWISSPGNGSLRGVGSGSHWPRHGPDTFT